MIIDHKPKLYVQVEANMVGRAEACCPVLMIGKLSFCLDFPRVEISSPFCSAATWQLRKPRLSQTEFSYFLCFQLSWDVWSPFK